MWICGDRFVQSDCHIPPVALEKGESALLLPAVSKSVVCHVVCVGGGVWLKT